MFSGIFLTHVADVSVVHQKEPGSDLGPDLVPLVRVELEIGEVLGLFLGCLQIGSLFVTQNESY